MRVEVVTTSADELPANVGTRQHGVDWPTFLGPDRNGKSPETGILTTWPAEGLRLMWQRELGESYGIGFGQSRAISAVRSPWISGPLDMSAGRNRRYALGV